MKKYILLGITAFLFGLCLNNFAISSEPQDKLGVVDVVEVVANSPDVKMLKASQEKQIKGLQDIINQARTEIYKETDPTKQAAIQSRYSNEINVKKDSIDNEYTQKLKEINEKIKCAVEKRAKAENYTIIVSKSSVLYGGDDLTQQIISDIK